MGTTASGISVIFASVASGVAFACVAIGCAQILGAQFDDAQLDAGGSTGTLDGAPGFDGDASGAQDFDPRVLDHLVLWLAADVGVTQTGLDAGIEPDGQSLPSNGVARWDDRSGAGHAALGTDPLHRPLLVRDASGREAGAPFLSFDRTAQTCLSDTWSSVGAPQGLTLFVVAQGDPTDALRFGPNGAIAFPWDANYARTQGDQGELHLLVETPTGLRATPLLGNPGPVPEVFSARLTAREIGSLRTYRNGQLTEQASLPDADLPSLDALTLGCSPGADEFATALVGEILLYTSALTDEDRLRVEAYLTAKWQ